MRDNIENNKVIVDDETIEEAKKNRLINFCLGEGISMKSVHQISGEMISNNNIRKEPPMEVMSLQEKYEIIGEREVTVTFYSLNKMLKEASSFLTTVPAGFKIFEVPKELIDAGPQKETFVIVLLKTEVDIEEAEEIGRREKLSNASFWENLSFLSVKENRKIAGERKNTISLGTKFVNGSEYFLEDRRKDVTFILILKDSQPFPRPVKGDCGQRYKLCAGDIILYKKSK